MDFYKTMVVQIIDGAEIGRSVLTDKFATMSAAIDAGRASKLNKFCSMEVRKYDADAQQNVISFDDQDTGKVVVIDTPIKQSPSSLVTEVLSLYSESGVEMSEEYLDNIMVKMSKAHLLEAWAEIQRVTNGDVVVRLDEDKNEVEPLVPEGWGQDVVYGNAKDLLLEIANEKENGGPTFARWYDDEEPYLDLVFGELDDKEPEL